MVQDPLLAAVEVVGRKRGPGQLQLRAVGAGAEHGVLVRLDDQRAVAALPEEGAHLVRVEHVGERTGLLGVG